MKVTDGHVDIAYLIAVLAVGVAIWYRVPVGWPLAIVLILVWVFYPYTTGESEDD